MPSEVGGVKLSDLIAGISVFVAIGSAFIAYRANSGQKFFNDLRHIYDAFNNYLQTDFQFRCQFQQTAPKEAYDALVCIKLSTLELIYNWVIRKENSIRITYLFWIFRTEHSEVESWKNTIDAQIYDDDEITQDRLVLFKSCYSKNFFDYANGRLSSKLAERRAEHKASSKILAFEDFIANMEKKIEVLNRNFEQLASIKPDDLNISSDVISVSDFPIANGTDNFGSGNDDHNTQAS